MGEIVQIRGERAAHFCQRFQLDPGGFLPHPHHQRIFGTADPVGRCDPPEYAASLGGRILRR